MVLLTITPSIARAITEAHKIAGDGLEKIHLPDEPLLADAEAGKPISHSQLIQLSRLLKENADKIAHAEGEQEEVVCTLDSLLKGSKIYIPPPPPKKEPTPQYKALMERLRREEEARAYDRMINPPLATETFAQRFPASAQAHFDSRAADFEEDDISYEEVHRQMVLIINVIVSIVACSVFIWVAARHWSAPSRLGLSMGGSGVIAVAEVVIYSGYVRRIKQAKQKEKKKPEIKEIIQSWVIDSSSGTKDIAILNNSKEHFDDGMRYRKGKHR